VAEGRHDQALAVLGPPERAPDDVLIVNPVWNPWRSLRAAALHGLGRTAEAVETAEEEVALLRRWGAPSFLGRGLCLLGELRGGAGLDELRQAAGLLAETPAAVDLVRARCALGSHPDVADEEAVPLLVAAGRLAEERGALGLLGRARDALERRGHLLTPREDGHRPLSRTDQQIVRLAAAGLEPHEVAQRLFVTPGTVRAVLDEADSETSTAGTGIAASRGSGNSQVARGSMSYDQEGRLP
jgi:hypothetical protein